MKETPPENSDNIAPSLVEHFSQRLLSWYQIHKRDLPWRTTTDPYKIWLSEIILQQTRIAQGLSYYQKFTQAFPTVQDLAAAPQDEVLKLWQGLGYYSRARNLHETAQNICQNFSGRFPSSYQELVKLKGVGDYTASIIASVCFAEAKAAVDGNVFRVLSRVFAISTPINTTAGAKEFKALAQSLLPAQHAGEYNQALMDFGAMQCKPASPHCPECIFRAECQALAQQNVASFPVKTSKIKIKKRFFYYCVLIDPSGRSSFEKREKKDIWQGLYQFPLLEFSARQSPEEIIAQIAQKYPTAQSIQKSQSAQWHKLTHQHISVDFLLVFLGENLRGGLTFEEIQRLPAPVPVANFLKKLEI